MPDITATKNIPFDHLPIIRGGFIFFYLSLTALALAIAGAGGLFLLDRAQTQTQRELIADVEAKEESVRPEMVDEIIDLDRRISHLKSLLAHHPSPVAVLRLIEANTHPQVRFLNFNFDAEERTVQLKGETTNYAVLAQQIAILEGNTLLERVIFGGLSLTTEGTISFQLTLITKPELFRAPL